MYASMRQTSARSGLYVRQPTDYSAFVPAPLPPQPPLAIDDEMLDVLSRADRALGRLDGSTEALPNPDLFVMMYVRKEAVLSSQIEGTQASLAEVLEQEAKVLDPVIPTDVGEVLNYVHALNYGIERLQTLPLSLRLICEIHERLMEGTRGQERNPGEFRRSQNWIGPAGSSLKTARFVPPAPTDMHQALGDWELFLHADRPMPLLLRIGFAHAQFETIHPFLDGNGRVGRLLIVLQLVADSVLREPLLYPSLFFKTHRALYYELLNGVRLHGDWERWLDFFAEGIAATATQAMMTAHRLLALVDKDRDRIVGLGRAAASALAVHQVMQKQPLATSAALVKATRLTPATVNKSLAHLQEIGIVKEMTRRQRDRVFSYPRYVHLLNAELDSGKV